MLRVPIARARSLVDRRQTHLAHQPPHPATAHVMALAAQMPNRLAAKASKAGGDRVAAIYSIIETAKLNGLEPQAHIADVIAKIAGNYLLRAGMNSLPGTGGQIRNRSPKQPDPRSSRTFNYPQVLQLTLAPILMSIRRDHPLQMTMLPGGGSWARAR